MLTVTIACWAPCSHTAIGVSFQCGSQASLRSVTSARRSREASSSILGLHSGGVSQCRTRGRSVSAEPRHWRSKLTSASICSNTRWLKGKLHSKVIVSAVAQPTTASIQVLCFSRNPSIAIPARQDQYEVDAFDLLVLTYRHVSNSYSAGVLCDQTSQRLARFGLTVYLWHAVHANTPRPADGAHSGSSGGAFRRRKALCPRTGKQVQHAAGNDIPGPSRAQRRRIPDRRR